MIVTRGRIPSREGIAPIAAFRRRRTLSDISELEKQFGALAKVRTERLRLMMH
jgi:hypothetical protein